MAEAYIIEIGGKTAGIVARDRRDDAFDFFAATRDFHCLEGQRFTDPVAAESAARRLTRRATAARPAETHRETL